MMGQLRVFMTITTVLISPVISYVTLKARTVLAAAIMTAPSTRSS